MSDFLSVLGSMSALNTPDKFYKGIIITQNLAFQCGAPTT